MTQSLQSGQPRARPILTEWISASNVHFNVLTGWGTGTTRTYLSWAKWPEVWVWVERRKKKKCKQTLEPYLWGSKNVLHQKLSWHISWYRMTVSSFSHQLHAGVLVPASIFIAWIMLGLFRQRTRQELETEGQGTRGMSTGANIPLSLQQQTLESWVWDSSRAHPPLRTQTSSPLGAETPSASFHALAPGPGAQQCLMNEWPHCPTPTSAHWTPCCCPKT